jgi:hypothetical protein
VVQFGSDKQSTYPAYTWSGQTMMQNCLIWKFQLNFSVIIETAELSKNEYIQNEELSENTQYYWRVGPRMNAEMETLV